MICENRQQVLHLVYLYTKTVQSQLNQMALYTKTVHISKLPVMLKDDSAT